MELHQTPLYETYIKKLGWKTARVDGSYIYYRYLPFMGGLAKIQRCTSLPKVALLRAFLTEAKIKKLAVEPSSQVSQEALDVYIEELKRVSPVAVSTSPFLATKTLCIDTSSSEAQIFSRLTEAKRRAVRRAEKNSLVVKQSHTISELIQTKNRSAGLFGFITTYGIKELWDVFGPTHATILLAYTKQSSSPIACVFLLFSGNTAYYWIAGATKTGKQLFAPTLLVWEALKRAKAQGCSTLDFVGVWDERLPHQNTEWKGFTKFKEGFGGTTLYYPIAMLHK